MAELIDISGQRFGLLVAKFYDSDSKKGFVVVIAEKKQKQPVII